MSRAAEDYVDACVHPEVKGGVLALLKAIAQLIPEGQTTTPVIGMGALAAQARLHRVTVVSRLKVLLAIGVVHVIDGGQGRVGRYTIVPIAGVRPLTEPELPLRADLRPVPRRPRPRPLVIDTTPGLFDDPVNVVPRATQRTTGDQLVAIGYKYLAQLVAIGYKYVVQLVAIGYKFLQLVAFHYKYLLRSATSWSPLGIVSRARDVHTYKKDLHTHMALRADEMATEPEPRPTPVHPWHAWCEGRVHVPKGLHADFLRWHGRRPGETDETVDAELVAFYARTCAELPAGQRTGNEFTFWNRAYANAFTPVADARAGPVAVNPSRARAPRDGITGSNCPHEPRCARNADCFARIRTEAGDERQEQSG